MAIDADRGDDFRINQPTVSNVITDTLNALCKPQLIGRFTRMPIHRQEIQHHQRQFHAIGGFPGVIGVIDGTHVRIIAPTEHENEYVNWKNFHSLNVPVVFHSDDRISDIVAEYTDYRIIQLSDHTECTEVKQVMTSTCGLPKDYYCSFTVI